MALGVTGVISTGLVNSPILAARRFGVWKIRGVISQQAEARGFESCKPQNQPRESEKARAWENAWRTRGTADAGERGPGVLGCVDVEFPAMALAD